MIWYDTIRYITYDTIRYDTIWYDMIWYDMIYLFNCSWVDTRWQQYSTHLHKNGTQNNTIKQNIQNRTYIKISVHKHNNKIHKHNTKNKYINIRIHKVTIKTHKWQQHTAAHTTHNSTQQHTQHTTAHSSTHNIQPYMQWHKQNQTVCWLLSVHSRRVKMTWSLHSFNDGRTATCEVTSSNPVRILWQVYRSGPLPPSKCSSYALMHTTPAPFLMLSNLLFTLPTFLLDSRTYA